MAYVIVDEDGNYYKRGASKWTDKLDQATSWNKLEDANLAAYLKDKKTTKGLLVQEVRFLAWGSPVPFITPKRKSNE